MALSLDDSMPKKLASGARVVHGINYGIFVSDSI